MGKNLLNYTTEIPVEKTIGEIQQVLVKAHATSILAEYDHGAIKAIMFKIKGKNGQELPFRLPAKVEEAYRVMYGDRDPVQKQRYGQGWKEQARRTAWRILLTWVKAQLALIELELAKPEEVFLPPYLLVKGNKTLFEDVQDKHFLLGSGTE
jgi:hypothetical protein